MIYLRQSTASQEVPLGYFLDSTDGDTEMTALTIANTDIKLWKAGATALANKNSGGATHISNGIYYAVLDATDTDTLGSLVIFVHVAGALAIRLECVVLAANVYDSMIAASDNLQIDLVQAGGSAISQSGGLLNANVTQISGDSTAADNFETMLDGTGGQTLSLGQLNIVNSAGSAIVASSTGGNGHGIAASGNGSGEGVSATGGATGHGMELIGGATSGNGLTATATAGNSHGIRSTGQGSGEGMSLLGGATGHGLEATGTGTGSAGIRAVGSGANTVGMSVTGPVGIQVNATSSFGVSIGGQTHGIYATSATNGHGIYAQGGATGGNGINAEGQAGNGHGLRAAGQGSGEGISAVGGSTGHGIEATGGASSGNGINAAASAGNGHGFNVSGQGSGHGLNATGGATGNGIDANGGATSGNGIDAAAPTSGDGMSLAGAGGGLGIDAAETTAILADTNELQTDWANGGRLDLILDARASQITADAIETDTQDIQSRLPAALVSGRMSSDAVAISGSTTAADRAEQVFLSLVVGAAQTGTLSTTQMSTNLTEATNDHYNGRLLTWVTGVLTGQQTDITDYDGTGKILTYTATTEAPADGDAFVIT